jgi:alcohol dehydrogenase class IV
MRVFTTVSCRVGQAFLGLGRKLHPLREQTVEQGTEALFALPQLLRSHRLRKPLLVAGGDAEEWEQRLLENLRENDVDVVVWENRPGAPTAAQGEDIRLFWLGEGCDCFIALGDGAVLDMVKSAAVRAASRNRTIMDMVGQNRVRRRRKVPPVFALPTVGGTGAEALAAAQVQDGRGHRFWLEDAALRPAYALLDPALLEKTPRPAVAEGGINGLCLAVEAYLSGYADEDTRTKAARAVEGFLCSVEPCWNNGGTVEHRQELLLASQLAGSAASQAGYGYVRALCRRGQTVTGLPFSQLCGALLPAVLKAYGTAAEEKLGMLAQQAGVATEGTRAERAAALRERIQAMAFRIGLPEHLEGMEQKTLWEIADLAAAEANPRCSSPVVWTAQRCAQVLEQAAVSEQ